MTMTLLLWSRFLLLACLAAIVACYVWAGTKDVD
jgi:hypothetical protein